MLNLTLRMCCKTLFPRKVVEHRNLSGVQFKRYLQYRILNYFETTRKNQRNIQQCETPVQTEHSRETIPAMICNDFVDNKTNKLDNIFQKFKIVSMENDTELVKSMMSKIHTQCVFLMSSLTFSEILGLNIEYAKVNPTTFTSTYFYHKSMLILMKAADKKSLSNHEIIQLLYFVSLDQKNAATYIEYLKPLLPDMNDLPLFEKCIAAQSFNKTSVKLQFRQSRLLEESIEQDFKQLINDPALLVTLCKALILSSPSDKLTLNNLSKAIIESETSLNFNNIAYILNLYSEILLFEPKSIDKLVKCGINNIRKDLVNNEKTISLSDLDTFLWSISYLGLKLDIQEKLTIRSYIEHRLTEYTTNENLKYLVNSILSLHMLRNWSTKIIIFCFEEKVFEQIFYNKFHWEVQPKLQLLISQINLEMKMKIPSKLRKQMKIAFTPSKNLEIVLEVACALIDKNIIKDAIIECPIKSLIIPGITLKTENEIYHVDVLDNLTCLKNTNIPNGLTQFKLRLLSRLRYRQILIRGQLFDENLEKVRLTIEDEIRLRIKYGLFGSYFKSLSKDDHKNVSLEGLKVN